MTPLRLVDGGFTRLVQAWMTSSTSPARSRTCRIGTSGFSSGTPCNQSVRAQGWFSEAKRGWVRRMRAILVPGGITTLVSECAMRSVSPTHRGRHSPECPRQPGQPCSSRPRGPTNASGLKWKGTKVKDRCWNPCWNPLLELLAGIPAATPAGTAVSALEPVLEPAFVRF